MEQNLATAEGQQARLDQLNGDRGIGRVANSLELLRAVYADPAMPLGVRMRAAIASLPFEFPKLAVTAAFTSDEGLAAALDRAIARCKTIEATPAQPAIDVTPSAPEQQPASELAKPFPRLRRV
jgi:hypothetical protein